MAERIVVRQEIPQPLTREERERIRCAAVAGDADPGDILRLLHQDRKSVV